MIFKFFQSHIINIDDSTRIDHTNTRSINMPFTQCLTIAIIVATVVVSTCESITKKENPLKEDV